MKKMTYVVRVNLFSYYDGCHCPIGCIIDKVFQDRKQAEEYLNTAQVKFIRGAKLCEQGSIHNGRKIFMKKIDEYVFAKSGEHIVENGRVGSDTRLPDSLTDEEVLEFGKIARIKAYSLIEFENEPVFYALWNIRKNDYYLECGLNVGFVDYKLKREDLIQQLENLDEDEGWNEFEIDGALEDFTDQPMSLTSLADNSARIFFDKEAFQLRVRTSDDDEILALRSLLKEPQRKYLEDTAEYQQNNSWYTLDIEGSLEEISDQSELLVQLIDSTKRIYFDDKVSQLRVRDPKRRELFALNELLKNQLFEVRELDLDAAMEADKRTENLL